MGGHLVLTRGLLVFGMDHASAAVLALELGMRVASQAHAQEVLSGEGGMLQKVALRRGHARCVLGEDHAWRMRCQAANDERTHVLAFLLLLPGKGQRRAGQDSGA